MRSNTIKEGIERAPHRALLYATGICKSEMKKPFIGVATSFTDIIPGHIGMRDIERFIEKGIHTGGGYPFLFGIPGICDGIAMGHIGHALFPAFKRAYSGHGRVHHTGPSVRRSCSPY